MIDTEALRKKVIDLAIRGKLTEQLPEDGTAEELYAQIQEEKASLVKEKKIKKEKPLPAIEADEIPFEIPKNWKWVRLSTIITLQSGQDLAASDYNSDNNGIPYITGASNFRADGTLIVNRWTTVPKSFAYKGDILLSCKGTVGKLTILEEKKVHLARQIMGIRVYIADRMFVSFFLECMLENLKNASKGLIPGIERNDILSLVCPLPPYAEQKRIVDKIDEVLSEIDIIDAFQSQYHNNLEALKSKIIDAGIRGKLTEQLPTDGTAEELYAQIQEEKARLVKEGKIKKEKPLPAITEDEIPFEIPKNWKWVHFADIALHVSTGPFGTMLHKADYCLDGIPLVNPSHMINGKIVPANNKRVNAETLLRLSGYKLKENDLVLARRGELGRCAVVTSKEDGWLCGTGSFFAHFGGGIIPQYIYSVFQTDTVRSRLMVSSVGATMSNLNHSILKDLPVPLPPLAEQKRIVDKIDEILRVI